MENILLMLVLVMMTAQYMVTRYGYGNINLLAKTKVDDSIMRVLSNEIAGELMEITFGDNS